MTVKSGAGVSITFQTSNASTGAAADATGDPVGTLYVDGVANAATVTVTKPTGTGIYLATVTLPTLTAGQVVALHVTATVAAVAGANIVWQDTADTSLVSDVKTETAAILADTGTDGVVLANDAITAAKIANGAIDAATFAAGAIDAAAIATGAIDADALATDAVNEIVDQTWNEATSDHATAGSTGKALSDAGAAGDPWSAAVRTLTSSAAATAATVAGTTITCTRGDTWSISLTGLGNIAARTKLWFTVKSGYSVADTESLVQIVETTGLTYINKAVATTAANGSITVTDAATGALTIALAAAESAKLSVASNLIYDIQMLTATGVTTLTSGTFVVSSDVTRATS